MKILNYNQINNLEIIEEEDKDKNKKIKKFDKISATTMFNPNFYYIVYNFMDYTNKCP